MSRPTRLEYALLCLIAPGPRSGYDLLKTLQSWPFAGRGRSPGALYPALERLEKKGLIHGRDEGPKKRPRKTYRLRTKGRNVLLAWATAAITPEEMLEEPDLLLLRFSFLPRLLGRDAALDFLSEYEAVARALRDRLRDYLATARDDASESSRMAMELSEALLTARAQWAERSLEQLSQDC